MISRYADQFTHDEVNLDSADNGGSNEQAMRIMDLEQSLGTERKRTQELEIGIQQERDIITRTLQTSLEAMKENFDAAVESIVKLPVKTEVQSVCASLLLSSSNLLSIGWHLCQGINDRAHEKST